MTKELNVFKKILNEIAPNAKAYFVGGYVRDLLLKKSSKDIDIEIFNIEQSVLEEILNRCAIELGYKEVDLVGKSYGIYKLGNLDISIPRREKKTGDKHTDFEVVIDSSMSLKEAAKRRDLTINAIYQDIFTLEILDPFHGKRDLKNKLIRHISDETFIEDPLRVFRVAQFTSRFEFSVDEKTLAICRSISVSSLPKERILEETKKAILKSDEPSIYFCTVHNILGKRKFEEVFNFRYSLEYIRKINDAKYKISKENTYDFIMTYLYLNGNIKESSLTRTLRRLYSNAKHCNSFAECYIACFKEPKLVEYFDIFTTHYEFAKRFIKFSSNIPAAAEIMEYCHIDEGKEVGEFLNKARRMSINNLSKEEILRRLK